MKWAQRVRSSPSAPRWGFVLVAIAASLAAWMRFTPAERDIIWAEDGRNFLQGAINTGPVGSVFLPYAGYLHVIPRLIAGLTVAVSPVSAYALWMTAGACLAAGVMAAIVFVCSGSIVQWMPARVLLAALTVLLPLAPREVLGNTANLHSLVFWTMIWVLLSRPRARSATLGLAVFAVLGTLTEIQCVFLLPLLLLADWRDRRQRVVILAFCVGVVAQMTATLLSPRHSSPNPLIGVGSLLYGYLFNAVVPVWVPQQQVGAFAAATGIAGCALLAAPFILALVFIMRWAPRRTKLLAIALVILSIAVYVASVEDTPRPSYDYVTLSTSALTASPPLRYGVVPGMLLSALIVIACGVLVERHRAGTLVRPLRNAVPAGIVAVLLCAALVAQPVPPTRRANGPEWQPEVAAGSLECTRLPDSWRVPLQETIGWHVAVPCSMLETTTSASVLTR